eukprot:7367406-Lingulodinium_polyedra.AAC.1
MGLSAGQVAQARDDMATALRELGIIAGLDDYDDDDGPSCMAVELARRRAWRPARRKFWRVALALRRI